VSDAELVQGSPEWLQARIGSVGSSEMPDVMRKLLKDGSRPAAYVNLMTRKAVERLTGKTINPYVTRAMMEGTVKEPEGRATYSFECDAPVQRMGLVRHPRIAGGHASPDGLVGDHGLVEIKCPEHTAHAATWITNVIDRDYLLQMQWQMACTERLWCDYVSYHPDFPAHRQLYVKRVEADKAMQAEMERELGLFIQGVNEMVAKLNGL
jgi:hypothetical protein